MVTGGGKGGRVGEPTHLAYKAFQKPVFIK